MAVANTLAFTYKAAIKAVQSYKEKALTFYDKLDYYNTTTITAINRFIVTAPRSALPDDMVTGI
jgi:hypothetical protein